MASPDGPAPRAPRRDAQRNRQRVLVAAEQVFAERGLDATLEEIAARAGVGVGTGHRRFGSKDALLEEVFEHRLSAGAALLAESLARPSAAEGVADFLRRAVELQTRDRGLHEFLFSVRPGERWARLREQFGRPLAELVERAQAEGALRADLRASDIPPLIMMLGVLAHTDPVHGPALSRRFLGMFLDGLAARPGLTAVEAGLDDEVLAQWWPSVSPRPLRAAPGL